MKILKLVAAGSFVVAAQCNAQFEIKLPGVRLEVPGLPPASVPEVKIPEIGVRTDAVDIPHPKADVVGDLQHPHRIFRNVERTVDEASREADRLRLEAMANMSAPALSAWLVQSRNDAVQGGVFPIPNHIRKQFAGFYDEDVLNRARYKIGDTGAFNLARLATNENGRGAIVLVDVVVFNRSDDVQNNVELWAHELRHVQQYRDWGVNGFATRYLRSWNSVEEDATGFETNHQNWLASREAAPSNYRDVSNPIAAQPYAQAQGICSTPQGFCSMAGAAPGYSCYCSTVYGPVQGVTR